MLVFTNYVHDIVYGLCILQKIYLTPVMSKIQVVTTIIRVGQLL